MGYNSWDKFQNVITKAKTACENSGVAVSDHFRQVRKMVQIGSEAMREIEDIILTRYACYLIAQNGDSKKEQIAFAQTYFAIQTRKQELVEQRLELEDNSLQPKHGIFYGGQIYDAYAFVNDLLKSAKREVVLIDNMEALEVLGRLR